MAAFSARLAVLVATALLIGSASACYDAANACGQGACSTCGYGDGQCHCSVDRGQVNADTRKCSDSVCAVCNLYGCNCVACNPGCSDICGAGTTGRLLQTVQQLNNISRSQSCTEFKYWTKETMAARLQHTSKFWCADPNATVGFSFFGFLLSVTDKNNNGNISCDEWIGSRTNFNVSALDHIVRPLCAIKPIILANIIM